MGTYRDHLLNAAALAADTSINNRVAIDIADELQRAILKLVDKEMVSDLVDQHIRSLMAAALADPDVDPAAKSLAGYLLQRGGDHD